MRGILSFFFFGREVSVALGWVSELIQLLSRLWVRRAVSWSKGFGLPVFEIGYGTSKK